MDIKPIYRAVLAAGYIAILALGMTWVSTHTHGPDTVLAPIMILSLLVLSVAVMAFLFFAEPVIRLIAGDKNGALTFFLATVGWFALIVSILVPVALFVQ